MSIWFEPVTLEQVQRHFARGDNLAAHLEIRFTELGLDYLKATMPVDARTHQPYGILHGGASVALAETMGSVGAQLCVDSSRFYVVGQEINANHVRSVRSGLVTGTARPLHLGRRSQVWDIRIADDAERLVCVSRLTMSVLDGHGRPAEPRS